MKKILVVDDDKSILEVVELILSSSGYDVKTYTTGYDVLSVVDIYDPDLVLLDINLPYKTGTEICNELKAISNHPPIILFSAEPIRSFYECDADDFIQKPFEVKHLIAVINSHLKVA